MTNKEKRTGLQYQNRCIAHQQRSIQRKQKNIIVIINGTVFFVSCLFVVVVVVFFWGGGLSKITGNYASFQIPCLATNH